MSISNPNSIPFTPRVQRVTPIHDHESNEESQLVVDLIFVDLPTSESGAFTMIDPDPNNVIQLNYSGTIPSPNPGNVETTTLLYFYINNESSPIPTAIVSDGNGNELGSGTPNQPIRVPRDGDLGKRGVGGGPCEPCESHPTVLLSSTNPGQYYAGGIVHVPVNYTVSGQVVNSEIVLTLGPNMTPPSPTDVYQQFVFYPASPGLITKMYIPNIGDGPLAAIFIQNANPSSNPPQPAINLYTDTPSEVISF